MPLPTYDRSRTYDWNYEHAPAPVEREAPPAGGDWRFCGLPVDSPLGVPAGPLLNGKWCLYYASLGFDVLTYKTVRSRERACYPLPNLQPVACESLQGGERDLPAVGDMRGSWAVAFGMPSKSPERWRADVEETRRRLPKRKVLSVSVVGTMQPGWTLDRLADDYALCARWAVESGADCVETNFSCPNVSTCDGQLYQTPADAAVVAYRVREAIGSIPLVIKIGHLPQSDQAAELVQALAPHADALAMTNSIGATVRDEQGERLFDGESRGICGAAILEASLAQVRMVRGIVEEQSLALDLVGVGGARTTQHVRRYLDAGAHAVHLATAAMIEPDIALRMKREWDG